ncbi:MAG: MBL fold metallo-hydrolase [Pseudomonadota bacterium]
MAPQPPPHAKLAPDHEPEPVPEPGHVTVLQPGLRRVVAPNPGPMTYWGTNTYLLGSGAVTVIDPGPDDPAHLEAVIGALEPGERITRIAVTHAHIDHTGLAPALARETGAPVAGFGLVKAGRSAGMRALAAAGLSGGGEGLDHGFRPDLRIGEGARWGALGVLATPGHAAGHLVFRWGRALFSGDTVMAWASTLVSPPDGDLAAFMASTERLASLGAAVFYPGHGPPITDPVARCRWLLAHRRSREAAILDALAAASATAGALARAIYTETPPALLPAATRNVFAHLIALEEAGRVTATPTLQEDAVFALASP